MKVKKTSYCENVFKASETECLTPRVVSPVLALVQQSTQAHGRAPFTPMGH